VLAAGAKPADIIFSGVGKTRAEIARALEAGIGCFNVESESELEVLDEVAAVMGRTAPVSIRVNPNVDPKTHPYISTGLKGNKFGIAHERTLHAYQRAAELPHLQVVGIDCHIGSQITESGPYLDAMDRVLDLVASIEATGIRCGTSTSAAAWASTTTATRRRRPTRSGPTCCASSMRAATATAN
jgi:diaminopimelate decarboxylase